MANYKRKQALPDNIREQFDPTLDFNARSIESLRILFKFLSSVDLREHSAKSLANLGKTLITNIRRSRRVLVSKDADDQTISQTVKLIDDLFEMLQEILLSVEDMHDLGLTEPADRQLIVSFMGEYLKVCNEEETQRAEILPEEDEEILPEDLVLDGVKVNDMLDKIILEK